MNLLLDDTRLPVSFKYKEGDTPYDITYNQYRLGLNIRTRFDVVSPIQSSITDTSAPPGIKQGIINFGNYIIIFVEGLAYFRLTGSPGWTPISGFSMSEVAPRFWFIEIPVNTTLYARFAGQAVTGSTVDGDVTTYTFGPANASLPINQINTVNATTTFGLNPGILVQDGINQPQFIFINDSNQLQCSTTQTYAQWSLPVDANGIPTGVDNREYVPIGTYMAYFNGILFIADPTLTYLYRSVSGRPLDFVINVDENGQKSGDATTTSYSVGVSGISCLRVTPGNALFVSASGANFLVTLNQTPGAPMIFGEYTFNRQVLFTDTCITDRGIIDISGGPNNPNSGDTVFIDSTGIRSFNAIETLENEGRNSVFSSFIQSLFTGITQSAMVESTDSIGWCSAVGFNDYALFSVNTVFGYVIVVYDTINGVWQSLDIAQLGNHAAKQFAAITTPELALYAITDDDRVVQLYCEDEFDVSTIRFGALCNQDLSKELKMIDFRCILDAFSENSSVTVSVFTNNRYDCSLTQNLEYVPSVTKYTGPNVGSDVGTQSNSLYFPFTQSTTGWKTFVTLTWTGGGSINSCAALTADSTPIVPLRTQAVVS